MTGRLFTLVGPSGAGKDTVLAETVARRPDLHWVRRAITRPESAGGEPFEGVSDAEFARRDAAGAFALTWQAHGLSYGIPATVRDVLDAGRDAIFNGSRAIIPEARRVFPGLKVILLTARPETRAARLTARGRETADDIAARLAREVSGADDLAPFAIVENDGSIDAAVDRLLACLQPESGAR
jgi:ribose 1,5-bisphosphokinase